MMKLPAAFEAEMRKLLNEEYEDYRKSLEEPVNFGLRMNVRKADVPHIAATRVPWISNGYYYKPEEKPARHPYYYAGLYYLQEPSAMTPASVLPIEPGDRVLDLCAAPGGKSTELGVRLKDTGFLVANDLSSTRAKALLKNLELFGIERMAVVSEAPGKLSRVFPEYFDKILVDAPCSGEGMFRKEPSMVKAWLEKGPEYYAKEQRQILMEAVKMLKPGGMLLFSTCTFSSVENEGSVEYLLSACKDMKLFNIEKQPGFQPGFMGFSECVRLFPHKIKGEGHFLALFRKEGGVMVHTKKARAGQKGVELSKIKGWNEFAELLHKSFSGYRFVLHEDRLYALPEEIKLPVGLRYLRTGLFIGTCGKHGFEPSQALAMCLKRSEFENTVTFTADSAEVIKYLKGETVDGETGVHTGKNGWTLVCVDAYPLGFAKRSGTDLKNKYYPGWRWQ